VGEPTVGGSAVRPGDAVPPSGPVAVSDEMAAHFRATLLTHADDPESRVCVRCGRSRCDEWRWAYERLVLAGRLGDLPPRGYTPEG
jgi:hypothetical protein